MAESMNIPPIPSNEEFDEWIAERDRLHQALAKDREYNTRSNQERLLSLRKQIQSVCPHQEVTPCAPCNETTLPSCLVCGEISLQNGGFTSTMRRTFRDNHSKSAKEWEQRVEEDKARFTDVDWELLKKQAERIRLINEEDRTEEHNLRLNQVEERLRRYCDHKRDTNHTCHICWWKNPYEIYYPEDDSIHCELCVVNKCDYGNMLRHDGIPSSA